MTLKGRIKMIITSKEKTNSFKPVEINIIIENIEEAQVWYSLFDNPVIKEIIGYGNSVDLRTGLTEYYSWDEHKKVEADFIKVFYETYRTVLSGLIDSELVG
jgi:hypothetical protein